MTKLFYITCLSSWWYIPSDLSIQAFVFLTFGIMRMKVHKKAILCHLFCNVFSSTWRTHAQANEIRRNWEVYLQQSPEGNTLCIWCIQTASLCAVSSSKNSSYCRFLGHISCRFYINTLRPRQLDAIWQTTFSNAFSWMRMFEFLLKFHWSLFLRVELTIFQYGFRYWLGAGPATSNYLNQWW